MRVARRITVIALYGALCTTFVDVDARADDAMPEGDDTATDARGEDAGRSADIPESGARGDGSAPDEGVDFGIGGLGFRDDEPSTPRVPRIFREISFRLPRQVLTAVAAHPKDPEIVFVGSDGFLFKTDDGGETWRPVLTFPRGLADDVFLQEQRENRRFFDPLNNDLPNRSDGAGGDEPALGDITADDVDELLEDDTDANVEADDFEGGARRESGEGSVAIDDDLLPDGDVDVVTLQGLLVPERPGVRAIVLSKSGATLFAATPRGLFVSRDTGETFELVELPGGEGARDIRAVAIDPDDEAHVFVGTREGTYVSTDGTASFLPVVAARREPVLALSVERMDARLAVHIGDSSGVLRSWDGGATFLPLLLQGMSAFEPVNALAFDARHGTLYAGTPSGLFVAERRAAILERRLDLFGVPVVSLSVDPLRRRGVAIGLDGGGLVASEDTALTFIDLGDNVPALTAFGLARVAGDPDALLVATERGLFKFDEGTGILVDEDRLRVLEDAWAREPTMRETVEAALDYQALHPRHFRPLSTRARVAAFAPRVQLQYRLSLGRRTDDQERYVLLEDEPDEFDGDDEKDLIDLYDQGLADFAPQRGLFHSVFLTFTWRLDRLVFNPNEPRVLRLDPMQKGAEARVADQAQALFVARRRLQAELVLGRAKTSTSSAAAMTMRLQELDALLDGITGGRFSGVATERGGGLDPLDPLGGLALDAPHPRRRTRPVDAPLVLAAAVEPAAADTVAPSAGAPDDGRPALAGNDAESFDPR